jgi:hypothetical protein
MATIIGLLKENSKLSSGTIVDLLKNPAWSTVMTELTYQPQDLSAAIVSSQLSFEQSNPGIIDTTLTIEQQALTFNCAN